MRHLKLLCAILSALNAGIFFACSTHIAGGSSEETNTIAGIVTLPNGDVAVRVAVEAQAISGSDSTVYSDTTGETGEYSISIKQKGVYGLSAIANDFAFYDTVSVSGKAISRNAKLVHTGSISGTVYLRTNEPAKGATVSIAGSPWKTFADEDGSFTLFAVPLGEHGGFFQSQHRQRFLDFTAFSGLRHGRLLDI